jgi:hypothetical protein
MATRRFSTRAIAVAREWCPYPACGFGGTEDDVDDHRASNHQSEAQQGSNLHQRPRD